MKTVLVSQTTLFTKDLMHCLKCKIVINIKLPTFVLKRCHNYQGFFYLSDSCNLCNGMPIYICEEYFTPMTCEAGEQFCMNILVNLKDGSRTLDRKYVL